MLVTNSNSQVRRSIASIPHDASPLFASAFASLSISITAVALRFTARRMARIKYRLDDWTLVAALVTFAAEEAVILHGVTATGSVPDDFYESAGTEQFVPLRIVRWPRLHIDPLLTSQRLYM